MTLRELLASIAADVHALAQAQAEAASPLMTAKQVAEFLQVNVRTLRRLELMGDVPKSIRIGGAKRWRRAELQRAIERRRP